MKDNEIVIEQGLRWSPDMVLVTGHDALMRVVAGTLPLEHAINNGQMEVQGSQETFYRTFELFGVQV